MSDNVLIVDTDGRGVGSQVDEDASATFLSIRQHAVGHDEWREEHVKDCDVGLVEAFLQAHEVVALLQDVEEVALDALALYAYRVVGVLVVNLVFLCDSVEDLLVGILHAAVGVHELVDHLKGDLSIVGERLDVGVSDALDRLTANTDIDVSDTRLECRLQFLYDIGQGLYSLLYIVDHTLPDACCCILLCQSEDADTAIFVFSSRNAGYLRRA